MSYISLENAMDDRSSIYKIVITASKRAQEVSNGAPALIEGARFQKPSTTALQEIAAGKVTYKLKED